MRKSDREITDPAQILAIVKGSQTVRLGLFARDYPYIVPLSFGYEERDGVLTVYFHCAKEGKKVDLIARDERVCLEWDALAGYVETGHSVTADYESVIAFGCPPWRCTRSCASASPENGVFRKRIHRMSPGASAWASCGF